MASGSSRAAAGELNEIKKVRFQHFLAMSADRCEADFAEAMIGAEWVVPFAE
jgi:hypothetical protein